jgi:hypothetical protein
MRRVGIAVLLTLASGTALAQTTEPYGRRIAATNNVRVTSNLERITSGVVSKVFFVPYGGTLRVRWDHRSNGSHQVDSRVLLNDDPYCTVTTTAATYGTNTCLLTIPAGSTITLLLVANGQEGAIRNAQLLFNVIELDKPAVVVRN